ETKTALSWPPEIPAGRRSLRARELGVFQVEPLHAGVAKIHLQLRVGAAALGIDDDAHAELRVADVLANPEAPLRERVRHAEGRLARRRQRGARSGGKLSRIAHSVVAP